MASMNVNTKNFFIKNNSNAMFKLFYIINILKKSVKNKKPGLKSGFSFIFLPLTSAQKVLPS